MKIGTKNPASGTWVQTERRAHQAWAMLIKQSPRAAQLLHVIVANMSNQNALVISQRVLAELCQCSLPTLKRAINVLEDGNWIQRVKIGRGKECAYVVNSRVAWARSRDNLHLAAFNARVIVDKRDQNPESLKNVELMRLPVIYKDEIQVPHGEDKEPPVQYSLEEHDPDLPSRPREDDDQLQLDGLNPPEG